jgi:outer membrane protein TolC
MLAADQLLKVARSLEREGLQARSATAEVEAGAAEAALAWSSARRAVERNHLTLAELLSLAPGADFAVDDGETPPWPMVAATDIPRLEQAALENRPELLVQDLARQIAASSVRQRLAEFLPRLDGLVSYNWSSLSTAVNPGYWRFGVQVSDTLLGGGRKLAELRLARKAGPVEEERALLLALGVLYEIDFRLLQLYALYDTVLARESVVTAQTETLRLVVSRYLQGLESGSDAVRTLAAMYAARIELDRARTEYQAAWFELSAAALAGGPPAAIGEGAEPARTGGLPSYQPAPPLASYPRLLDAAPAVDLSQFPELRDLLEPREAPAPPPQRPQP